MEVKKPWKGMPLNVHHYMLHHSKALSVQQTPTVRCGARLAVEHAHEGSGGGGGRTGRRGGAQRARAQPEQRLMLLREGRRGRQGGVRTQQAQLQ